MVEISMLAVDLAKGSFQVCGVGPDGACVDAPCLASVIFGGSAGSSIGRVSGLLMWPSWCHGPVCCPEGRAHIGSDVEVGT